MAILFFFQRPKRKPLTEYFIDEEEELESKSTLIHFFDPLWSTSSMTGGKLITLYVLQSGSNDMAMFTA